MPGGFHDGILCPKLNTKTGIHFVTKINEDVSRSVIFLLLKKNTHTY